MEKEELLKSHPVRFSKTISPLWRISAIRIPLSLLGASLFITIILVLFSQLGLFNLRLYRSSHREND
jgi:hypothetical protein